RNPMRIGLPLCLAALVGGPLLSLAADTNAPSPFKDDREKAGYALGGYFGNQLNNVIKQNSFDVDTDVVAAAMHDVLAGKTLKIPLTEVSTALRDYQMKRQQVLFEKNSKAGDAFLAQNKKKPGVQT